jgi:hypothetical protein
MKLPSDHFNAELRKLGRGLGANDATEVEWRADEIGLRITWADGFSAFVGLGPMVTAIIESGQESYKH